MKPSPLQLESCFFTTVSVSSQLEAEEADLMKLDLEIAPECSRHTDDPTKWFILLSIKIKGLPGAKPCYLGEVELFGNFIVAQGWPEDQIEKLVFINGSGILYAAAREMISNITARGPFEVLVLPSCSFYEMYNERQNAPIPAPSESPQI